MDDQPLIKIGSRLWEAAERSRIANSVRNLGESGGIAVKEAVGKSAVAVGETLKNERLGLSDVAKKLTSKGGAKVAEPVELKLSETGEIAVKSKDNAVPMAKPPDIHEDIHNFAKVDDHVYRGGLPTDEQLASMKQQGITQIINLMDKNSSFGGEKDQVAHEQETARKLGLKWLNFTVPWGTAPTEEIRQAFLAAVTTPGETTYVHCKLGRDRTGAFIASYRIDVDHYTEKQAMDEMQSFGFEPKHYPFLAKYVQAVAAEARGVVTGVIKPAVAALSGSK